jgi:hypothetical protein
MKPIDPTIATEAVGLVSADRQKAYGHPAKNFEDIARLWSVVLGYEVTAAQVGLCMVQVKIAREIHVKKRDNLVDAVGYLLAYDATKEEERATPIRIDSNSSLDDLMRAANERL